MGGPQDVEWAIDRDLPDGENVVILQSRPETVWSQEEGGAGRPTRLESRACSARCCRRSGQAMSTRTIDQ